MDIYSSFFVGVLMSGDPRNENKLFNFFQTELYICIYLKQKLSQTSTISV